MNILAQNMLQGIGTNLANLALSSFVKNNLARGALGPLVDAVIGTVMGGLGQNLSTQTPTHPNLEKVLEQTVLSHQKTETHSE